MDERILSLMKAIEGGEYSDDGVKMCLWLLLMS